MNKEDRNYLSDVFRSCGLGLVGFVDKNEAYSLYVRSQNEFLPILIPNIQSIRKVKILTGIIGVGVKMKSLRTAKYSPLISAHSSDFPELASLHELARSRSSDIGWGQAAASVLRELPTSRVEIEEMIERRANIRGVPILNMIHQEDF